VHDLGKVGLPPDADSDPVRGRLHPVLATRILHHPHVNEQPFTRSLGGVMIPADISAVTVRAHDSVHGYGGKTLTIQLSR
jgi:hypothetical protein